MVAPATKGLFITRAEAIKEIVIMTITYVAIVFSSELYSWVSGKRVDELLTPTSYKLILILGSLLYVGFLISWGYSVYKSYKHHREKKRYLKDYKSN